MLALGGRLSHVAPDDKESKEPLMKCQHCGAEVVENAAFCQACGEALGGRGAAKPAAAKPAAPATPAAAPGKQAFNATVVGRRRGEVDPDQPLWEGSFSKLAMLGSWVVAGVVTLVVLIWGFAAGFDARMWGFALTAVA